MTIGGTPEYRFHPTRKWRFDYAWPENKIALEVEGGSGRVDAILEGPGFSKIARNTIPPPLLVGACFGSRLNRSGALSMFPSFSMLLKTPKDKK